jgi:hypothetical protein
MKNQRRNHSAAFKATVAPYGTDTEPDYWSQLDKQRLSNQTRWYTCRDIALVISTGACVILSVGLVLSIYRNRKDPKNT